MKTLTISLADIEGVPFGSPETRTFADVEVRYTGPIALTDGTVIPQLVKSERLPNTGTVQFEVYASDDPQVATEYHGFAIVVEAEVRRTVGFRKKATFRRTVKVLDSMTSPVALGSLAPAEGLPAQWVSVTELMAEVGDSVATQLADPTSDAHAAILNQVGLVADDQVVTVVNDETSDAHAAIVAQAGQTMTTEINDTSSAAHAALVAEAGQITDPQIASAITTAGSDTSTALDAAYAAQSITPEGGVRAVGKGEIVVMADDYGAVGDGITDDTAAIGSAMAALHWSGGTLRLSPGKTYRCSQVTLGTRHLLEVPGGTKITRPTGDPQTGPMVVLNRHHGKIYGGGTIECLNGCPDGVVRIERVGGACEWTRITDIHVDGPGEGVVGSRGVVMSGNSTFQNTIRGVTVSNIDAGVYCGPGANANHFEGLTLYNIGSVGYDFDQTIESSVLGGSILAAEGGVMFRLSGTALVRVIGTVCEPGGTTAALYDIDSTCDRTTFVGVVANTSSLGTDSGSRTGFYDGSRLRIEGGSDLVKHLTGQGFPTFGDIAPGGTLSAEVAVPGAAKGDDATAHPNSIGGLPSGIVAAAVVDGGDAVTIVLTNASSSSITVPSGASWRVRVWR